MSLVTQSLVIEPFVEAILKVGGEVYAVGGTVRDELLGLPSKDRDLLVSQVPLEQLTQILERFGRVLPVGRSFGVLKFYPQRSQGCDSQNCIDIALPRKEQSTGQGHRDFAVDFDPKLPIEIDLGRRDFTINAMARHLKSGRLIDPFNGQGDLEHRILRTVFAKAFEEDPLRLLRGVQFASRFKLKIANETLLSMKEHAERIKTVSGERTIEEIRKLFLAEKPSAGFFLMKEIGLLKYVFPELHDCIGVSQANKLMNDDVFEHTMRVLDASRKDEAIETSGDLELMFAALYHDIGKPSTKRYLPDKDRVGFYGHQTVSKRIAKKRLRELKVTVIGVDPKRVLTLIDNHMFQTKSFFTEKAIRRFISKIGEDLILKLVDLRLADNRGGKYPEGIKGVLKLKRKIQEEIAKKPAMEIKDLALNGHDLMEMGIPAGPQMGSILKALMQVVLDDPTKNEKETLKALVQEEFSK